MTATFTTERWCPYHGGFVLLADCPIVATNERFAEAVRADLRPSFGTPHRRSSGNDEAPSGPDEVIGEAAAPAPRLGGGSNPTKGAWAPGDEALSFVDQRRRLVLAPPPPPPASEGRRWLRVEAEYDLPSPAELASFGGPRSRPARLCPEKTCHHPLPAWIDDRDPFVVAVAGVTGASKSTFLTAVLALAASDGRFDELGVEEFQPSEATLLATAEQVERYEAHEQVIATPPVDYYVPWEVKIGWGRRADPGLLLLHDVAGETYMRADERTMVTPFLLWPDVLLFLVDPELHEAVGSRTKQRVKEATILTGILQDLEHNNQMPPLFVALSKADLLGRTLSHDALPTGATARELLLQAGARDVVAVADQWRDTTYAVMAPQPLEGEAFGVLETVRAVLERVRDCR